jgi:hypothetical protein
MRLLQKVLLACALISATETAGCSDHPADGIHTSPDQQQV